MEKNIFEDAKFGDRFITRNGEIFSYLGKIESLFGNDSCHQGLIEDRDLMSYYNDKGKSLYAEFRGSAMNASDVDFTQVNCEEDCDDIVSKEPPYYQCNAISLINYLDEHCYEGKMCFSNMECADLEKAFDQGDWAKVIRYINKYYK